MRLPVMAQSPRQTRRSRTCRADNCRSKLHRWRRRWRADDPPRSLKFPSALGLQVLKSMGASCRTLRLSLLCRGPGTSQAGGLQGREVQDLLQEVAQLAQESGPRGFIRGLQGAAAFTSIGTTYVQNLLAGRQESPEVRTWVLNPTSFC